MKKTLFVLFLSVLSIQCSKNNDDTVVIGEETEEEENGDTIETEELIFTINVDGNYFSEDYSGTLYISDEEGTILTQTTLKNNQGNTLTIDAEVNKQYDAIVSYIIPGDSNFPEENYFVSVFQDIKSSTYNLSRQITEDDTPKLTLELVNTGNLEIISLSSFFGGTGSGANGGIYTFEGKARTSPGDFYISLQKDTEDFGRYFWVKNITENSSYSFDYEELPITAVVETEFPDVDNATISVEGYRNQHPSVGIRLSKIGNTDQLHPYQTYTPNGIFDYYKFYTRFNIGNASYNINSFEMQLPSGIEVPELDFSIENFAVNNTSITTNNNYDAARASYNLQVENEIYILFNVYSEKVEGLSASKARLFDAIFENIASAQASSLEPNSITLFSYNYIDTYDDFLDYFLGGKQMPTVPGTHAESVSKSLDQPKHGIDRHV